MHTPSLEALKAFSSGEQVLGTTGSAAAIPFFKHAIELDPKFALAYAFRSECIRRRLKPLKLSAQANRFWVQQGRPQLFRFSSMLSNSTQSLRSRMHSRAAYMGTLKNMASLPTTPERLTNSATERVSRRSILSLLPSI